MKTSYDKGREAYEEYIQSGMLKDVKNPFCEQSDAGIKWQKGYDDARNEYLR